MKAAEYICGAAVPTDGWQQSIRHVLLGLLLAGGVSACAVAPDFQHPNLAKPVQHASLSLPAETAAAPSLLGAAQHYQPAMAVEGAWWQVLGSARLDALIETALQQHASLAAAQARLRQAQELYAAQAASTAYPQIEAALSDQRQKLSPSSLGQRGEGQVFSLYQARVGVQYRFDLAGGNQRVLEALAARSEHRRYELEGAHNALAANIAAAAIRRAMLAGQIVATAALLATQDERIGLAWQQVRLGHIAPDALLPLQRRAEEIGAGLPVLHRQLAQSEHLLATLAGYAPGAAVFPSFTLGEFRLPQALPVLLPAELVRRRPDILAAEALLQAATADYGVAVAKFYPQVSLGVGLGSQALTHAGLFGSGAAVWSVLAQLTQPLFNPALPAEKRAALAALDAAAANYQLVVLDALRNVADTLRAVEHDAQYLAKLAQADDFAQRALASVTHEYELGAVGYDELLLAKQQTYQGRIELVAAQSQRLTDSIALFSSMAGGSGQGTAVSATGKPSEGQAR